MISTWHTIAKQLHEELRAARIVRRSGDDLVCERGIMGRWKAGDKERPTLGCPAGPDYFGYVEKYR